MGALDLTATMDGIAALLLSASVAPNVYAYPVESVTVPCAVVGYPTEIALGVTFQRGHDTATFPVWVVVGKSGTKDARDALSLAITGAANVWTALTGTQSFGDVAVLNVEPAPITIAAVEYIGLKYTVEVI